IPPFSASMTAHTRLGFAPETVTPMRPRIPSGSPWPLSSFQVVPPSLERYKPLPGPPLSRLHGVRRACHSAANRMFELLGSNTTSKPPDEGNIRIPGIHGEAPDGVRVAEANELPGLTRVDRLVDTITTDDVAANTSFSGSNVNDVGVRFGNRDGPDRWRCILLRIENWFPVEAAIGCLPHASGDSAKIIDIILADNA